MSRRPAAVCLALALLSLAAAGCGDDPQAERVRQRTAEAWQALADYGADRREEFVRELEALTEALDVQLDNLRARSARATGEAKQRIEELLAALQAERGDLERRLAELRDVGREAWTEARDGALDAFRTLRDGVDQAVRDGSG